MKIPTILTTNDISASGVPVGTGLTPSVNPVAYAAPWEVLAKGGQTLSQVGLDVSGALTEMAHEQARIQRAIEAEDHLATAQLQVTDLEQKLKQNPDPATHVQNLAKGLGDIYRQQASQIADPVTAQQFQGGFTRFARERLTAGKVDEFKMVVDESRASTRSFLQVARMAAGGQPFGSPGFNQSVLSASARLQEMRKQGVISEQEHEEMTRDFQHKVYSDAARVESLTDPLGFASGGFKKFEPYMIPRDLTEMVSGAQTRAVSVLEHNNKQLNDSMHQQTRAFVGRVIRAYADPASKDAALVGPGFLDEGLSQFEGFLSPEEVNMVTKLRERPYLDGGVTKPETFHSLRIRIISGDPTVNRVSVAREVPNALSAKDAESLMLLLDTHQEPWSRDSFYKEGLKQLQILLAGGDGVAAMLQLPIMKPQERIKYSDALNTYNQYARGLFQKGTPLDQSLIEYAIKLGRGALGSGGLALPGQAPAQPQPPAAPSRQSQSPAARSFPTAPRR